MDNPLVLLCAVLLGVCVSTVFGACPSGWSGDVGVAGRCHKVVTLSDPQTWMHDARRACIDGGGDIAALETAAERTGVIGYLSSISGPPTRVAVGLYQTDASTAHWLNGQTYTAVTDAPAYAAGSECGIIKTTDAWVSPITWEGVSCCTPASTPYTAVLCETPEDANTPDAPVDDMLGELCYGDCPSGWHRVGDQCIGVETTAPSLHTPYTAHEQCQTKNATLPYLPAPTGDDFDALLNLLKKQGLEDDLMFYLANNDVHTADTYKSPDRTAMTTAPTWAQAGDAATDNCVRVADSGSGWAGLAWSRVKCCENSTVPVLCQRPMDSSVSVVIHHKDDDDLATDCFQDINECESDPCQNGGNCTDHVLAYLCDCPNVWDGSMCQDERDFCESNPCMYTDYGNNCTRGFGNYTCDCSASFEGENCDTFLGHCLRDPCLHGGECSETPSTVPPGAAPTDVTYECDCTSTGYKGDHCEIEINECLADSVRPGYAAPDCNTGTCVDGVNFYTCECPYTHAGEHCETEILCPLNDLRALATATRTNNVTVGATHASALDIATYTCNTQAKPRFPDRSTSKVIRCLENGWEDDGLAECEAHCDELNFVANSEAVVYSTVVGETSNFTCIPGYRFPVEGNSVLPANSTHFNITCQEGGGWDKDISRFPDCEIITCPELPDYDHQEYLPKNRTYNTTVTFWCDVGYLLHDNTTARTIKCLPSGRWTAKLPECQPVRCPVLDEIENGSRNTSANTYNTYAQYSCNNGQRMLDGASYRIIRCDATGTWSDNVTDCHTDRCYPLPYVAKARPSSLNATFTNVVTLTCIKGHRFMPRRLPSQTITCHDDHRWRPLLSRCEPINCPPINVPDHASLSTDSTLYGTVVDVKCDLGHYFGATRIQVKNTECLETERWSVQSFDMCNPVDCGPVPIIYNGSVTVHPPATTYGNKVEYQCDGDKKFIDGLNARNVTCGPEGEYDESDLSCRIDRCSPVPAVGNANKSTRNTTWDTVVEYTCMTGYEWEGGATSHSTTCLRSPETHWSNTEVPDCTIKKCPDIYDMPHSSRDTTEKVYNTTLTHTCDIGYEIDENTTAVTQYCNEHGQWAPSNTLLEKCEIIKCPVLQEIENATLPENRTNTYNSQVTIPCNNGYQFPDRDRVKTITCLANKTWDEIPPPCEVVYCPYIKEWRNYELNFSKSIQNEFESVVYYSCANASIQQFEDIATNPETVRRTECNKAKNWEPALAACVDRAALGEELKGVTYEADSAVYVGTFACTLLSILVATIILLDLQKLMADFRIMGSNIRSLLDERKKRNRVSDSSSSLERSASPPAMAY